MAEFNGKQGRWITTKTGRHVFVEKGQSVKQALADAFEEYTYDNEKKYGIKGWTRLSLFDTEEERKKAYRNYSDKDFDFELDYNKALEILNDPNLSKTEAIRKLGDLFGEYGPGNNYDLGAALFEKYFKDEYEQIVKKRETKQFQSKIEAAEKYLSTMPKIQTYNDPAGDYVEINYGANYHNYHEAKKVYKYGWDDKGEYNPAKAKKLYDAYTSNCQRCVMAWFLRLKGYNVQACEYDGNDGNNGFNETENPSNYAIFNAAPVLERDDGYRNRNWAFSGFNIPKNTKFDYNGKNKQWASTQFKEIKEMVQNAGPGAVYFCTVKWRGYKKNGHVFVVHNNDGEVNFLDPQDNSDASKYFDKNRYGLITENTTLLRVDNLTLNGDILPDIVKKYEEKPSMEDKVWKKI